MLFKIQTVHQYNPEASEAGSEAWQSNAEVPGLNQSPRCLHHMCSVTHSEPTCWQLMAKLNTLLQILPPTISSHGWEESEGCWEHSGSLLPEHHLPWVGPVWPEEPPLQATGAVGNIHSHQVTDLHTPGICGCLSSPGRPWVSPHPAGTHTDEACSGTNCGLLAYNEGTSRRDLDIF